MSVLSSLITKIKAVIYPNTNNEIDAQKHQDLEVEIVETIFEQIDAMGNAYLGTILATDIAPTPGKSGFYKFSTGGVVSWLQDTPTVSPGDQLSVIFSDPNYTYSWIDGSLNISDSLESQNSSVAASSKAVYDLNQSKVSKSGDENIEGVKTFAESPIIPTPTTDYQATTKEYVDVSYEALRSDLSDLDAEIAQLRSSIHINTYELNQSSTYIPLSNVNAGDYVYVEVLENSSNQQVVVSSLNGYSLVETIFNTTLIVDKLFKCTQSAEKIQIYCQNYSGIVIRVGIIKNGDISSLLLNSLKDLENSQELTNVNVDVLSGKVDSLRFSKKEITYNGVYSYLNTDELIGLDVLFVLEPNGYNIEIEYKSIGSSSFTSYGRMNRYNPYTYLHIEKGEYRFHTYSADTATNITLYINPNISLLKKLTTKRLTNINIVKGGINNGLENYIDDEYTARTSTIFYNINTGESITSRRYFVIFPNEYICTLNFHYSNSDPMTLVDNYIPFSFSTVNYRGQVLTFKKKDGSILTDEDITNLNNNVKLYIHSNYNTDYDLIVAASNTPQRFKKMADIVLDGSNDNEILQAVVGCFDNIKILLYPGTYNINKQYITKYGQKGSLFTNENVYNVTRNIQIEGYYELSRYTYSSPAKLITTTDLYNTIKSGVDEHSIIAVTRMGEALNTTVLSKTSMVLKNLSFASDKYDAPIRFVDMIHASSCYLSGISVYADKDYSNIINFNNEPNTKLVGIAVGHGSNNGIGNKVERCVVFYCYAGVQCCGEHYIFEDVLTHHCINGFEFGTRPTRGNYEHPNVMLGCSIEGCYRLMLLSSYGETVESETWSSINTLICIGLSTEMSWGGYGSSGEGEGTTLPIKEIIKGKYRGYISADGSSRPGGGIFEQDGSGKCMQWKSYLSWHSQSYGTQKPLATYVMPGTVFMNTSNGKPIFSTGQKWVNSDGTDA